MKSKVMVFSAVVVVVIAAVIGLRVLGPDGEDAGYDAGEATVQNNPADRSIPQVQAWLKNKVKDPQFRVIEWGDVERTETGYTGWVKYLSKNAMGGAVVVRRTFKFDAEGNITAVF